MNSLARQKLKWKRELKEWFQRNGLGTFCESCGSTEPPLDISHRKKQRFILDRSEYFLACILCRRCHVQAEHSGHENLRRFHDELIANRLTEAL